MKLIITLVCVITCLNAFAQAPQSKRPPINWQLLDWKEDGYFGISLQKAYMELLKAKTLQKKIIVAIIDDGMDFDHPDLKGLEWTNKNEIAGNGVDDDHNGFTDDVHGWNFIGNLKDEQSEELREYVRLKARFESQEDTLLLKKDQQYSYWLKICNAKNKIVEERKTILDYRDKDISLRYKYLKYWQDKLRKDTIYYSQIIHLAVDSSEELAVRDWHSGFVSELKDQPLGNRNVNARLAEVCLMREKYFIDKVKSVNEFISQSDPAYFRNKYLGDDPYSNIRPSYGNNYTLPLNYDYSHAMHVAGIIGGCRDNQLGGNGITNAVTFMNLSINRSGDEWDKDVANAIMYAADNGAQLINMSFGKYASPQKKWVDDAVAYAEKKGVLLFVAAGNEKINNDSIDSYPNAFFLNGKTAGNLLTIGASTLDSSLVAPFSNYGKATVDLFAPGVDLYSATVNGTFAFGSGTSFSTPVVTGLAALIWSYYPAFTYRQIRHCIEASVIPIGTLITRPGSNERIAFKELSRSGGIVNAYRALQIAEGFNKANKQYKTKSLMKKGL